MPIPVVAKAPRDNIVLVLSCFVFTMTSELGVRSKEFLFAATLFPLYIAFDVWGVVFWTKFVWALIVAIIEPNFLLFI